MTPFEHELMALEYSNWMYSPCENWYVRYATSDVDGQKHSKKEHMHWRWAKTNIPIVKRGIN